MPKPDLAFDWRAVDIPIYCSRSFQVRFEVRNRGTAPAPQAYAGYRDRYGSTTVQLAWVTPIPALAAGGSASLTQSLTIAGGCGLAHTLTILLDSAGAADESDETNNSWDFEYTLNRKADLVPQHLKVPASPSPHCATAFNVTLDVANTGSATAPASLVEIRDYASGELQESRAEPVGSIAAGGHIAVTIPITVHTHCGQTHQIRAIVDARDPDNVDEIDEHNNVTTLEYTLRA